MHHMYDMELNDDEKLDYPMPLPMKKKPDYPCGLIITLTEREFEKLPDIDPDDAVVGGLVHIAAMARVVSVSHRKEEDKECRCVTLQIEDLGFETEDSEQEPDDD